MKRFVRLNREYRDLKQISDARKEYVDLLKTADEARELLSENDAEMRQMAREELESATERLQELEEEIKQMLLPSDPQDDKNVIVEIRGGTGGDKPPLCRRAVPQYTRFCESEVENCRVIMLRGTAGGFKEIIFTVTGEKVWDTEI